MQRRFRKMKCVIDFDKLYDPMSLEYALITTSKEFLNQGLDRMPKETIQDCLKRFEFWQSWKMSRALMYGKEGGE
jgi:hypothetical protein